MFLFILIFTYFWSNFQGIPRSFTPSWCTASQAFILQKITSKGKTVTAHVILGSLFHNSWQKCCGKEGLTPQRTSPKLNSILKLGCAQQWIAMCPARLKRGIFLHFSHFLLTFLSTLSLSNTINPIFDPFPLICLSFVLESLRFLN